MLEERKRSVQKQLGEVLLSVAGLQQNQTVQNSYPVIGDKGEVLGELRIRATYTVDVILPTKDYNELLGLLITQDMTIVRELGAATKEKSNTARHLVHVFQARDLAEGFIKTIIKEEIERTPSIEVLFRGNTVCTKAMDHFMKLVGSMYQREVLMPIIEVILRESQSLEVQKEKLASGDDWKRNVQRLQKMTELLLQRIFQSTNHCPPPIRSLLAYIRQEATSKFKDSPTVRHTAVTSFIFLRFFVPAVLNPKQFGLTAAVPTELHMRIFTLVAGVLQKLANLTKYRDQEQHINVLNPFLDESIPKTKQFIDDLVDVSYLNNSSRQLARRPSIANSIQIDVHLAGLVREFAACRPVLNALADKSPLMPNLFTTLDTINRKLEAVKVHIYQEELGLAGLTKSTGQGLDTLLSQVIQTEISPNSKTVTVKKQAKQEELPEGATKARQRSSSFLSRGIKKLTGMSNHKGSTGSIKVSGPPSGKSSTSTNADTNSSATRSTSPSRSTPRVDSIDSEPSMPSSRKMHVQANPNPPISSSAPKTMPVRLMKPSTGSESSSLSISPAFANGNLDVIKQHREAMKGTNFGPSLSPSNAPAAFGAPKPVNEIRMPVNEPWFAPEEHGILSDIEILEHQTDYHGLTATGVREDSRSSSLEFSSAQNDQQSGSVASSSSSSTPIINSAPPSHIANSKSDPAIVPASHHDYDGFSAPFTMDVAESVIPEVAEEQEEEFFEEPLEEVVVFKLDVDITALQKEFDSLEKIISDIRALPAPPPPLKSPLELIPEIQQLERVVEELEEAVVKTTPKVHLGADALSCHFCRGTIDAGSKFLVVMGKNFHERHLNCNICGTDLADVAFQWYKEKSYCFPCYKKGYGIRPMCVHCNQPIMTPTYTQALGKYWHPEHFVCTVCGDSFPNGTFFNFDNKPYCAKHQNRGQELPVCGQCHHPITDANFIEALDKKWHSHHFCCDICSNQLLGQFVTYENDDGSMSKACEHHFQ